MVKTWSKSLRFLFPHGAVKGPFSCRQFLVSLRQKAWRGAQSPGCNQYCSRKLAALLHIIGRLQSSQPRPSVCVFCNSRSVLNTTLNWCPLGRAVWELGCQGDQWRRLVLGLSISRCAPELCPTMFPSCPIQVQCAFVSNILFMPFPGNL